MFKLLGYRSDIPEILKVIRFIYILLLEKVLSVSLMEAMISGLPVVCSKIRGNTDLIHEGKGGYLINPNDINGFAKAIKTMVENQIKSERFVEYNKEKIVEFSNENVLKRMEDIYKSSIVN